MLSYTPSVNVNPEPKKAALSNTKKIVILGQEKTGKTALLRRVLRGVFNTDPENINMPKTKKMGEANCELFDTSSNSADYIATCEKMKNADAFIYVFDSRKLNEQNTIDKDMQVIRDMVKRSPHAKFHFVFSRISIEDNEVKLTEFYNNINAALSSFFEREIKAIVCSLLFLGGYDVLEKNIVDAFAEPVLENKHSLDSPKMSSQGSSQNSSQFFASKSIHDEINLPLLGQDGNSSDVDESKEDPLITEIKATRAKLIKERDSFWPYPNKMLKDLKANFWEGVLATYAVSKNLPQALGEVMNNPAFVGVGIEKGYFSHRTADLITKIQKSQDPQLSISISSP